jgi:glycosyltransferase involved in cell wall biosynthesis
MQVGKSGMECEEKGFGMLVTVYIPTRNRVDALAVALESVLRQSHSNLDVIVVNDGSTDGTSRYLEHIVTKDSRVRVIDNSASVGAPASRNQAIRMARGAFVTGLDDDDCFEPRRISAFINYWRQLEMAGSVPAFLYSQDVIRTSVGEQRATRKPPESSYDDLFTHNCVGNQIFAPKSHFIDAGLFDEGLPAWQDLEFFMRILGRFGSAKLLDEPTYMFDDSPRPDRISAASRGRIERACTLVAQRHASGSRRRRQRLLLQMFSRYYGFRPTMSDWSSFLSDGVWPGGIARLLRATFFPGRF